MAGNTWSLGERTLSGDYHRVMAAGAVHAVDAHVDRLYAAGEVSVQDSYIGKLKAAGDVHGGNARFGAIDAAGDLRFTGDVSAERIVFCGSLSAECLTARILRNFSHHQIEGASGEWREGAMTGDFTADTFENGVSLRMGFSFAFRNILSVGPLIRPGELECERLYSFAPLCADAVNGDYLYLKPLEASRIGSIAGGEVILTERFRPDAAFRALPLSLNPSFYLKRGEGLSAIQSVESIEADRIHIEQVKARRVSGHDVTVGPLCIIETLEYSGSVDISPKAIVGRSVRI